MTFGFELNDFLYQMFVAAVTKWTSLGKDETDTKLPKRLIYLF